MSKTIDAEKLLEWLSICEKEALENAEELLHAATFTGKANAFSDVIEYVESGRFDSDILENEIYKGMKQAYYDACNKVGRLRAALERIKGVRKYWTSQNEVGAVNWEMPYATKDEMIDEIESIADVALSNTAQEPIKPTTGWYCPTCNQEVPCNHVTFDERHDERAGGCGGYVGEEAQEPIGADRVREIYEEWVAEREKPYDPNFPIYGPIVENRIAQIEEIAHVLGITIPGINQREKEE
jgi:hypothetical protein